MKMLSLLLLPAVLLCIGCSGHQLTIRKSEVAKGDSRVRAGLKRTGCFGTCPIYEVRLMDNDSLYYYGNSAVPRMGFHVAKAPSGLLRAVVNKADSIGYFALHSHYPPSGQEIPDLPLAVFYLHDGKRAKEIRCSYDAPYALNDFMKWFDSMVEKAVWKKAEAPRR